MAKDICTYDFVNKLPVVGNLLSDNRLGIGIYSSPDLTLLEANQRYLDLLDAPYNRKEVCLGLKLNDFIPWMLVGRAEEIWMNVINTGNTYYGKEIKGLTGSWKNNYCDNTIIPVAEDGEVKFVVSIVEEVTEKVLARKRIEEQAKIIAQQKEQLEAVIDNVTDALLIFDKDGNYTKLNKPTRDAFFSRFANLKKVGDGRMFNEYFDGSGHPIPPEGSPARRVMRGEKLSGYKISFKMDDRMIFIEINGTPLYDENGNFTAGVLRCRNITEQVEKDRVIKNQKEQLEAIIQNMTDGLYLVDRDFRITLLNQAIKDFFYNYDRIFKAGDQSDYNQYYYGIDGERVPYEDLPAFRVFKKGKMQDYRLTLVRPDKKIYASFNGIPICDGSGNITSALLCVRDITAQVRQDEMIKSQQEAILRTEHEKNDALKKSIEMKDEFLSLISHEFKTPITVINSAIQAMELICKNDLSEKARGFISNIRQNSLRQLRLVNNLLDITRINSGQINVYKKNMDIVLLTRCLVDSVYLFAWQKDVKLSFVSAFGGKMVGIDEEKYERILLNLLSNAIKFTPKGKTVTVKLFSRKGNICIEVKDEGIGIPEDKLEFIFERFGQVDSSLSRQAEGTGIGLSLVKLFVEVLGGSISVKSKPGKGSCFTLLLPAVRVVEDEDEKVLQEFTDSRLIRSTAIEFSDIYL